MSQNSPLVAILIGFGIVGIGAGVGFFTGAEPIYFGLLVIAAVTFGLFFASFEYSAIALLVLRSSLSNFTELQLASIYAIAFDILTLSYIIFRLVARRKVQVDSFWWLFAAWVALQSLWLLLMPLGGLGFDASYLSEGIREWIRRFTFLMVYLLVMQLKDRLHPHKVISLLFLSLIVPIITGLMQLPSGERVYATLGHPNALATYLALMMGLIWWRQSFSHNRLPWLSLLGLLTILYVSTRSVGAIFNIGALILILNATKLNFFKIITAIIVFLGIIALFASTEAGQARFAELLQTPLLNPDLDISRTIIVAAGDGNSFNWRVAHWYYLLQSWTQYPILGYGMGTGQFLSPLQTEHGGFTPHNDYIRFLVEQGVVGLVLFLVFIAIQFVYLVKRLQRSVAGSSKHLLNLVLLSFLLANLVNMLSNNVMDIGDFWFYWWAVFAVAGWESEKFKTQYEN